MAVAVGWLEGAVPGAVAGRAVDRALQHVVAVVDVLRRQGGLGDDVLAQVVHAGGAGQLVEDHLAAPRRLPSLDVRVPAPAFVGTEASRPLPHALF